MKKKLHLLLKTGKRYNSSFFRVYIKTSDNYKIGFIANKKVGKASTRVRIKRIIREFWKKNFNTGDFLFILKPCLKKINREEIIKELEKTVDKIKCEKF